MSRCVSSWVGILLWLLVLAGCPETPGDDDVAASPSPSPEITDLDEDGYIGTDFGGNDCNDGDPAIYPGAEEVCDGVDNDCDSEIDEDVTSTVYPDTDGDGYGDETAALDTCSPPDGYVDAGGDCDDTDPETYPGAIETCDGLDNDCNGEIDDGVLLTWYQDIDHDGHGDPDVSTQSCEPPPAYAETPDDCDDQNASVYPGAEEVCDGLDNDCDSEIDEDVTLHLYADQDGDGYGDETQPVETCDASGPYATVTGDCDDQEPQTYPGAGELCDGVDNDCDGEIDEDLVTQLFADTDGDGHGDPDNSIDTCEITDGYIASSDDCDDTLASVYPGADEVCDGVDNDCDGAVDEDLASNWYADTDGDGYGAGDPTTDCAQPGGFVAASGDCDDTNPDVNPAATETCNGVDDNCDDIIDAPDLEGNPPADADTWYQDQDTDGHGDPTQVLVACSAPDGYVATGDDCDDGDPTSYPGAVEQCDGADNDCDGAVDNDVPDMPVWYLDADNDGYGTPDTSEQSCERPIGYVDNGDDCDDTNPAVSPAALELVDGQDNDCDGLIDDGTSFYDDDGDGYTENDGDCDDADPATYPGAEEVEDGADNDCDSTIDEGTAAFDDDGDGYTENDGDCDDGNPDVIPGVNACPWEIAGESCAAVLYAGMSQGDGFYELDLDGTGAVSTVWCDMTTDGGGWTLLGTISGADEDNWNTEAGLWADTNVIGNESHALDRDYKSDAWFRLPISRSQVLIRRSFGNFVRAETVLDAPCLSGKAHFSELFENFETSLACTPDQIHVLHATPVGVADGFREGNGEGLGAPGTNGFCWNGEDTSSAGFKGHLVWNAYPDADCSEAGHSGGVGVFWESNGRMTDADITGTNWLYGTDYSATVISIFARTISPNDADADGFTTDEGDCDDSDSTVYPGTASCPWEVGGASCSEIRYDGLSQGDGVYRVSGADGSSYDVYCDMTTDGGGWTLLGTVAGGDDDRWNTEQGLWNDSNTAGSLDNAFDQDYKSPAWSALDISGGEILYQRRYDKRLRGEAVLSSACLGDHAHFSDLFTTFDTSLACAPSDIRVLETSPTGVASATYAEGASSGLGGSGTNGLCWNGEDTADNRFKGRLVWNDVPGADCSQSSHLGGIAVFWEDDLQYTVADITGTNWLYGTNYAKTAVSFFVRVPDRNDEDGDGYNPATGDCDDADPDVYPGSADCAIDVGGTSCLDIAWSGNARGDGRYRIDPGDGSDPYVVYCDMTTDGGGWTLVGTISGGDDNHWDTETGFWADNTPLGTLDHAFDADYKSRAWYDLEVTGGELLWRRQYNDTLQAVAVLGERCLEGLTWFNEGFETFDRRRVCAPSDIRVLRSSSTGVNDPAYAEGGTYGLGGSGSNGFCWNGEDTEDNVFKSHLFWNQYPGTDCDQGGHIGGVGVFWENSSQYTVADITGTNWLYGTDYSATDLSLFTRAPTMRTNPLDWDMDGFTESEGDCDDSNPLSYPGTFDCPGDFRYASCLETLEAGKSFGDGIYVIDIDGAGPMDPFKVYCDMTTDGGGWTLLGTISGGDANEWADMVGYWGNEDELGSLIHPFDQDFKSSTWYSMDITGGEILYERRYQDVLRAKVILSNPCLGDKVHFNEFFETFDTSLACLPGQIEVIQSSAIGVYDSSYAEGASYGLGGAGTNGFCWNGEDTQDNVFKGHIFWNQYPGSSTCSREGHLGGIGVFWENSSQYTVADITGTNWLYGTDYSATDISFFVR